MVLSDIAAYIHSQINGTFDDIDAKLSELVEMLEYANDGSITAVSLPDAKVMIEEVGVCPGDLEVFLSEEVFAEKSVAC